MTEQKTLQGGIHMMETFGPYMTLAIVFALIILAIVIAFIVYARNVKKNAVDPSIDNKEAIENNKKEIEELRKKYGLAKDEINGLRVEIERRVPFSWAEDKLIPRIDSIDKSVNKLGLITEKYMAITEQHTKTGEQLTHAIDKLADRLSNVESSKR